MNSAIHMKRAARPTISQPVAARGIFPLTEAGAKPFPRSFMKVVSSIKSAKTRHPDCQVVRRKGRIYVINKTDPRYKARQG